MLKFNKEQFQKLQQIVEYLNTSHVKVQPFLKFDFLPNLLHLNTSHVKVQLSFWFLLSLFISYLNTSHVKVQLKVNGNLLQQVTEFKYISC